MVLYCVCNPMNMTLFKRLLHSRKFWINTAIMLAVTFILFWMGFKFLNIYTRHGSNFVVPDFSGLTPEAIMDNDDYDLFKIVVFDSIYDNSRPGGIVIDQDPPAGTEVKRKRTVHLTVISKQQEMVTLPDLGNTARSARSQLEAYGLQLGKVIDVSGEYVGLLMGAFHLGKAVDEGDKIPKGSKIDIEVSIGKVPPDSMDDADDFFEDVDNGF